jgi:uncharacterized protein (DUF2236 family)
VWKYFGDRRIALIGPRPAVLQNMLAQLGQGVVDHSVFFADTAARIKRSLPPIYRTVYGSDDDNAGGMVRDFHKNIKGEMPDEFGGGRYHALDPATYYWAHATFFDQVLYFTDTFVRRLSPAEKEQMYQESKTWYRRYGVSDKPMPADYAARRASHRQVRRGLCHQGVPEAQRSLAAGVEDRCAGVRSAGRLPDHRWHAAAHPRDPRLAVG